MSGTSIIAQISMSLREKKNKKKTNKTKQTKKAHKKMLFSANDINFNCDVFIIT